MNKPTIEKRTFSLSEEQSDFINSQVEAGGYASASEVVRAGIRALQERDEVIQKWLRDEVAPAYDAIVADPSIGIPIEDVMAKIRQRHAEMLKTRKA